MITFDRDRKIMRIWTDYMSQDGTIKKVCHVLDASCRRLSYYQEFENYGESKPMPIPEQFWPQVLELLKECGYE